MDIRINGETERIIKAALASGRFASAEEFIVQVVQHYSGNPNETLESSLPEATELDQLVDSQGVAPVRDFRDLKADFWPDDESVDDFLSAIRARREYDEPRAR